MLTGCGACAPSGRLEVPNGVIGTYLHASPAPAVGRMGALVGLAAGSGSGMRANVAEAAHELANKLAMHVVAMRPPYLDRETGAASASLGHAARNQDVIGQVSVIMRTSWPITWRCTWCGRPSSIATQVCPGNSSRAFKALPSRHKPVKTN